MGLTRRKQMRKMSEPLFPQNNPDKAAAQVSSNVKIYHRSQAIPVSE